MNKWSELKRGVYKIPRTRMRITNGKCMWCGRKCKKSYLNDKLLN